MKKTRSRQSEYGKWRLKIILHIDDIEPDYHIWRMKSEDILRGKNRPTFILGCSDGVGYCGGY